MTPPVFVPGRPSSGTPGIQYFDGAAADGDWLVWIAPGGRPFDAAIFNRTVEDTLFVEATSSPIDAVNDGTAEYQVLVSVDGSTIDASTLNNLPITAARFRSVGAVSKFTLGVSVRL